MHKLLMKDCDIFQEIPWSPEVRCLGLNLDKRLTFASHTANSTDRAERAFRFVSQ
jgi:hypothetical protein